MSTTEEIELGDTAESGRGPGYSEWLGEGPRKANTRITWRDSADTHTEFSRRGTTGTEVLRYCLLQLDFGSPLLELDVQPQLRTVDV